jgi:phage terminase large subunit
MGISSNGDNTARLKSISGITTLIVEEAEELTDETLFDKVNLSIRNKGKQNRVILILNPATKTHWIYNKFFVEKGVKEGTMVL